MVIHPLYHSPFHLHLKTLLLLLPVQLDSVNSLLDIEFYELEFAELNPNIVYKQIGVRSNTTKLNLKLFNHIHITVSVFTIMHVRRQCCIKAYEIKVTIVFHYSQMRFDLMESLLNFGKVVSQTKATFSEFTLSFFFRFWTSILDLS